jgi:sugar O-acyltransferase (sialic acid O-acetyltransferase NeuD family)
MIARGKSSEFCLSQLRDTRKGKFMAKLIIVGAGVTARMAHYYFTHDSEHEVEAFAVTKDYLNENTFLGRPLVDFARVVDLYAPENYRMFVAMGYTKMNKLRAQKYYEAKALGYQLVSYISSRCTFLTEHPVGDNCFILEDNTIQPFVKIGNDVTLWSGNHIGHDVTIEDHCYLTSHVVVSGFTHIHPYCFIGVNATLRNAITVAPETLIGAGAVIMKDTVEQGVYLPERAKLFGMKSSEIDL